VLLVLGFGDDLKKLRIAVDITAVLRRTPTFASDTTRLLAVVAG
jgi:hypothetical protein